ncbi:serine hydrolase domain-containing protein [Thermaurantiacus sp.]
MGGRWHGRALAGSLLWLLAGCGQVSGLAREARIASGYVARTVCTAVFVQGRDAEALRPFELGADVDRRLSFIRARVDRTAGEVAAGPFGVTLARAGNRPGFGCAVGRRGEGPGEPVRVAADPRPWPAGDAVSGAADGLVRDPAALDAALADAFREGAYGAAGEWPETRSIAIVHRGQLIRSVHAEGWSGTSPHYSASMSKTVAAVLAGQLIGEGRMGLEDQALLPVWRDGRRAIRVRHLLDMESGLDFNEAYSGAGDPAAMLFAAPSAALHAAAKPLKAEPGTRWSYSSGDTNILMRVARLKSGLPAAAWERFPAERLFGPVGMRSALFETDAAGDFVGSTFVFASAHDWARFGLMLADGGRVDGVEVVPAGFVARMRTPTALSGGRYSTQTWFRGGVAGRPARTLELAGYGGQFVTIVPETRTVVVRMGFRADQRAWDHARFLSRVFGALGVEAPHENRS